MDIKPIAYIKTDFKEKFGIPRQSGIIENITGEIIFEKEFRHPDALRGIEEYSHLWLIFDFSENHRENFSPTVRPPRLGGNKRVGVFATRSPFRPNNLGLSCVKLESIKNDKNLGNILVVSGVDLLDNTPIYDIKPYIPYSDCKCDAKGSFGEALKDEKIDVSIECEETLEAPLKKGEKIGTVIYSLNGNEIQEFPIVMEKNVQERRISWIIEKLAEMYFKL